MKPDFMSEQLHRKPDGFFQAAFFSAPHWSEIIQRIMIQHFQRLKYKRNLFSLNTDRINNVDLFLNDSLNTLLQEIFFVLLLGG